MGPEVNAYTLRGLKGGTEYEVQISGLTSAGEGAPSRASLLTVTERQGSHGTNFMPSNQPPKHYEVPSPHTGSSSVSGPVIMATVLVSITLIFGTLVVERYDTCLT